VLHLLKLNVLLLCPAVTIIRISSAKFCSYNRNMGSSTDLYGRQKRIHNYRNDLCPGMYDPKLPADTSVSPALDALPLSSLVSRTPRFGKGEFTGYGLGSTYRPETDERKWLSKPVTISKAEYLRPQVRLS
jgi:hypothetical protein